MVRDYARRDPLKRSPRRASQSKPFWPWIIISILSGALFTAGLSWYLSAKTKPTTTPIPSATQVTPEEPVVETPKQTSKKRAKKNTSATEQPTEPRFDFYTVLPTTESPEMPAPEPEKELSAAPLSFVVQAGSFDTASAADSLKAQLTLQGLEPQTQQIMTETGQIWYRVYFGPFKSEKEAMNQQRALNETGLTNSSILKLDQ